MKHRIAGLVTVLVLVIIPNRAIAFDMNPIDVECWGNVVLCKTLKLTERLKFPVHETMTLLAYDYYEFPDDSGGGAAKTSADVLKKSGRLRDLVLGSEWNDDPDSLLRQGVTKALYWYALFNDAKLQAECKRLPTQTKCEGKEIATKPMMLYRSHFGDLQFIHSMASSDDETAKDTKARMMAWAKFTYGIFISPKNLEERRIDDNSIASFSDIAKIINKPGWTVGALFDPVPTGRWIRTLNPLKYGRFEPSSTPRQQNGYTNNDGKVSIRYMALGSLLHMIQDSYSDSHTARKGGCNPIARSKGKIIAFRNYSGQKGDEHGIADVHPAWLENGKLKTDNALWASAHILQFALKSEPVNWEDGVGEFLDQKVFPLVDPVAKPEPGDGKCFSGLN